MKEADRLNGRVRITQAGHGGYELDISGDVNSYVVSDAIGQLVRINDQQDQAAKTAKRNDFIFRAATTGLTAIVVLLMGGWIMGFPGCSQKQQNAHPTWHYQGH